MRPWHSDRRGAVRRHTIIACSRHNSCNVAHLHGTHTGSHGTQLRDSDNKVHPAISTAHSVAFQLHMHVLWALLQPWLFGELDGCCCSTAKVLFVTSCMPHSQLPTLSLLTTSVHMLSAKLPFRLTGGAPNGLCGRANVHMEHASICSQFFCRNALDFINLIPTTQCQSGACIPVL